MDEPTGLDKNRSAIFARRGAAAGTDNLPESNAMLRRLLRPRVRRAGLKLHLDPIPGYRINAVRSGMARAAAAAGRDEPVFEDV